MSVNCYVYFSDGPGDIDDANYQYLTPFQLPARILVEPASAGDVGPGMQCELLIPGVVNPSVNTVYGQTN